MIELKWRTDKPTEAGLYFVAAELGPAAGVYDFVEWDGERWDTYPSVEIIGYLGLHEFNLETAIGQARVRSLSAS